MPGRLTFGRRSADEEAISLLRHRQQGEIRSGDRKEWNRKNENTVDFTSIKDLAELEEITLQNVLICLVERYKTGNFYTYAGSVLISLNPIASPISRKSLSTFDNVCLFRSDGDYTEKEKSYPSVFSVGEKCLDRLSNNIGNHQVVVVSGESGAGKTTVTQQLLCYFIDKTLQCQTVTLNRIDKKIYFATIILESLGNASTTANKNSSRFGRFIQLDYGRSENLVGAKIRTCLLEKHRVSKFEKTERNFHIFYYILAGLKTGIIKVSEILNENISGCSSWENSTPNYLFDGMMEADKLEFHSLIHAFQALKMTQELQTVFRVIYGIMMLIRIQFVPLQDDEGSSLTDSRQEYCEFIPDDEDFMRGIGALFSVDPKNLSNILVSRTITVLGQGRKRQSIFRKPCGSVAECESRKYVIASALYDTLFGYVLRRLNSLFKINPENDSVCSSTDTGKLNTISLLDLYGFESLAINGLEQLCINYANERLQLVHIQNMKSYASELETFPPTELIKLEGDSLRRLKSVHETIFTALDEACLLNRNVSEFDTYQRIKNLTVRDQFVEAKSMQLSNCQFLIKHYASEVKYSFRGMVDKNSDNVPPEFREFFTTSTNPSIRLLFNEVREGIPDCGKTPKGGNKREKTILQRFKASVDDLATELLSDTQDVHFIRCIRPSDKTEISTDVVKTQLFSSGLVDIIRITGDGFPIRLLHTKFASIFPVLLIRFFSSETGFNGRVLSKMFNMSGDDFRIGRKQFFFTEEAFNFLKKLECFLLRRYVLKAQRCFILRRTRKMQENLDETVSESGAGDASSGRDEVRQDYSGNSLQRQVHSLSTESQRHDSIDRVGLSTTRLGQHFHLKRKTSLEIQFIMDHLNLRRRDGILTRGQLFKFPVRFHTRKTLLPFSHCCPKTQGVNELLK